MPKDNTWNKKDDFRFKQQDYQNSCFASCLQTVLVNWDIITDDIIKNHPRPFEEDFNLFFNSELDIKAPSFDQITSYLNGKRSFTVIDYTKDDVICNEALCNTIKERMENSTNCAVIGALKNTSGHALCLMRSKGRYYGFNPALTINDARFYNDYPLKSENSTDGKSCALNIPKIGCIDAFYLITPKQ